MTEPYVYAYTNSTETVLTFYKDGEEALHISAADALARCTASNPTDPSGRKVHDYHDD